MKGLMTGALFTLLTISSLYIQSRPLTVYTWVDERGIAHFSYEEPRNGVKYKSFELKEQRPSTSTSSSSILANEAIKGSNEISATDEEIASLDKRREEYCKKAKYNLDVLENYGQIKELDENGKERYISEKQQKEYKKQARQRVSVFCKK